MGHADLTPSSRITAGCRRCSVLVSHGIFLSFLRSLSTDSMNIAGWLRLKFWSFHGGDRTGSSAQNRLLSPCSIMYQVLVVASSKLIPPEELILNQFLWGSGYGLFYLNGISFTIQTRYELVGPDSQNFRTINLFMSLLRPHPCLHKIPTYLCKLYELKQLPYITLNS